MVFEFFAVKTETRSVPQAGRSSAPSLFCPTEFLWLTGKRQSSPPPPRADYAYRIVVDKGNLADLFATLAQSINYSKFKDCIARQPGQRPKLHAYHSFWASMLEVQHLAGGPGEG